VAGTKELDRKPLTERNRPHVEDPSIERLAEVAGHTDELAVRRQLFGWRELVSTIIPVALIAFFARNVNWGEAIAALRGSDPLYVLAALGVYYLSFPVRAVRWARLLREGGHHIEGRDLLRILMLGWFVNCLVPAKLGDLYRSYLVKRRFGISLSRTVGVVVAERLLDLFVVFGLLVVDGYVASASSSSWDSLRSTPSARGSRASFRARCAGSAGSSVKACSTAFAHCRSRVP